MTRSRGEGAVVMRVRWGWLVGCAGARLLLAAPARALDPPADLPRYDLDIRLDTTQHVVRLRQRVTWTNGHRRPAAELVFNVYPRYKLPDKDLGLVAKTVELLRQDPAAALDTAGRS